MECQKLCQNSGSGWGLEESIFFGGLVGQFFGGCLEMLAKHVQYKVGKMLETLETCAV